MSPYSIAKRLNTAGYETATGGSTWYYGTVQLAIKALERAHNAPVASTDGPRRGLKRITREGWESLPEPVRDALIERIFKRVVGE